MTELTIQENLIYLFGERVSIMMEDGNQPEDIAIAQATWEIRDMLYVNGMDFAKANIKVMGIRKQFNMGKSNE